MDATDEPKSEVGEGRAPKMRAADNPWYLLATVYGDPIVPYQEDELRDRNRVAWNRYFAASLDPEKRAQLVEERRHSKEELTPFPPEELRELSEAFAGRKGSAENIELPVPKSIIDFSNVEFALDASFDGFLFTDCSFEGASFCSRSSFAGATFAGATQSLEEGRTVSGNFDSTTFSDFANFESVTFFHVGSFTNATFAQRAIFRNAIFYDEAEFDGATVSGADFESAIFSNRASFEKATFSGEAVFRAASFRSQNLSLLSDSAANFNRATFPGDAIFERARFSGDAIFQGTRFAEVVTFTRATFSKNSDFLDAKFYGTADFNGATFSCDANFRDAAFSGATDFNGAIFSGDAKFWRATFSGSADFVGAIFENEASFVNAEMKFPTSFERAASGLSLANIFNIFGFRRDFIETSLVCSLSNGLKALAALQTVVGAILIFLFGLGVRNRFRMK